jgi:hypothetical protein
MANADLFRSAALVSLGVLASCSGQTSTTPTPPQTPTPPTLVSIAMTGANVTIPAAGGTAQVNVVGIYSDGSRQDITSQTEIASSDPKVFSVTNRTGAGIAWSAGSVTLTAYELSAGNLAPVATGTMTVASAPAADPGEIATLVSPDDGAVVQATQTGIVTFNWSAVPGATAYHLDLKEDAATFPAIDNSTIPNPPWQFATGGLGTSQGWRWTVQAEVGGVFQAWAPLKAFSVVRSTTPAASSAAVAAFLLQPVASGHAVTLARPQPRRREP